MISRESKTEDILFSVYSSGFMDGQLAMIRSIRDFGLINEKLAELIAGQVTGFYEFDNNFRDTEEVKETIREAMRKIAELM